MPATRNRELGFDAAAQAFTAAPVIKVVLADDHAAVRRSLRRLLDREQGVVVCAEAVDLDSVIEHVIEQSPDVLVLDLRMPKGSSIDVIEQLRRVAPGTEIVVLTMEDSPAFAQRSLEAGAVAFVLKEYADVELVAAVRAAAAGELYLSPRIAKDLKAFRAVPSSLRDGRLGM
jgi:DNA-binding NarL/FixJ family response regulator